MPFHKKSQAVGLFSAFALPGGPSFSKGSGLQRFKKADGPIKRNKTGTATATMTQEKKKEIPSEPPVQSSQEWPTFFGSGQSSLTKLSDETIKGGIGGDVPSRH